MKNKLKLAEKFKEFNYNLSDLQANNFFEYYSLLVEWNEKFNLTAITDFDEVIVKHFVDSLAGSNLIGNNAKVLDIGAGAGFPSLPLKIYREDINLTMLDSLNKRIIFLNEVVSKLKLKKANAIHSRAEDFAKENRECYDCVVARAVARLSTLCEYCLPFVKIGGYFIAYKSINDEEVQSGKFAVESLGGKIEKIVKYSLGGDYGERCLLVIKKVKETPKKYPRNKNLPRLKPLEK